MLKSCILFVYSSERWVCEMICNGLRKGMQQSTKTSALSVCATESVRIDCNCKGNRYSVLTDAAFAVSFFFILPFISTLGHYVIYVLFLFRQEKDEKKPI